MSIKIAINVVMGLLALATLSLFLLGRGLSATGTKPAAVELVQVLPTLLFIIGAILQYVFRKERFSLYFAFLPLLYFVALQSVYGKADEIAKSSLKQQLIENTATTQSYLKLAPAVFTEGPEYYVIRMIEEKPNEKLFAVLLETPKRKVEDGGGNRTPTKVAAIELYLVEVLNSKTKVWKSEALKTFEIQAYDFSNVGLYRSGDANFDVLKLEVSAAGKQYEYRINPKDLSKLSGVDRSGQAAPPIEFRLLNAN